MREHNQEKIANINTTIKRITGCCTNSTNIPTIIQNFEFLFSNCIDYDCRIYLIPVFPFRSHYTEKKNETNLKTQPVEDWKRVMNATLNIKKLFLNFRISKKKIDAT